MTKIGRNDPCPCGSGKKYKRCCLAETELSAPYTASERISARAKMEAFSDGDEWMPATDEAIDIYWGDFDGADGSGEMLEQSEHCFDSWLWFDFRLADGRYMVDRFMERNPSLSLGERNYLEQMRTTAVHLYEIEAVAPGASLTLHNLLTGESVTVREIAGSRALKRWDVVAARVAPVGASGKPEIDDILPQPRLQVSEFVEMLSQELEAWRDENPRGNELYFFKTLASWFHQKWLEALFSPQIPTVMMPDGEKALITKVRFQVLDRPRLIAALDKASDMARDGKELRWQWLPKRRGQKEPPVWLRIEGAGLVLEALTKGSGERAQGRLELLAGGSLRAGLTTYQDLAQAMADVKDEPAPSGEDLPELDDLALEHYERHYRAWLDESIPALDGQTPREAAKTAALKPALIDLLKGLEHQYSVSLSMGQAGYDPFWMWEELGLSEALEAPRRHEHPPQLGHESMERLVPGLSVVVQGIVGRIRRRADFGLDSVVDETELLRDVSVRRFLENHGKKSVASGHSPEAAAEDANLLGSHLRYLCNFEIHRRKTFWVEEGLSWMLARTNLDIAGERLQLPFTCFALVFTDRDTLATAERLLSKEEHCVQRGRILQVVTVYVTRLDQAERWGLELDFSFDDLSEDWPYLVSRELLIEAGARLDALLDSHAPDVDPETRDPFFTSTLFKRLVQRVLNAILYATSPNLEGETRKASAPSRPDTPRGTVQSYTSEEVYVLPGHIDIRRLRQLQAVERAPGGGSLMHRFLVRGHWRRPNPRWKDQRLRWIQPYWKGPDMAALVERAYRLRSP